MKHAKGPMLDDLEYLFSKINCGSSFLDVKAVTIINELPQKIRALNSEGIKELIEASSILASLDGPYTRTNEYDHDKARARVKSALEKVKA